MAYLIEHNFNASFTLVSFYSYLIYITQWSTEPKLSVFNRNFQFKKISRNIQTNNIGNTMGESMVVPSENLFYSEIRNCKSKVDDQTQQSAVLI